MGREEQSSRRGRGGDDDDRGSSRGGREERGGRSSGRSSFQYRERSADSARKRGDQGGGDFDKYLDDAVKSFKPNDGDNTIRILPPTFDNAEHFGLDIFMHYGVGPDRQSYLCPEKMDGNPCPVCEERQRALNDGDQEYADKLKPNKRVLVYLIDRDHEKEGVQAWAMPWTFDRDLSKLMVDKRSGEFMAIDHPEDGYDLFFERKGKDQRTEYLGLSIDRKSSDLGSDKWLEFIQDNPLDKMLKVYDYDRIQKAFGGGGSSKSSRDRDDRGSDRRSKLDKEQDDALREVETRGDRSQRGRGDRNREPELPSWDDIHSMTFDELCSMIDEHKLDINSNDSKDDDELADWICEDLKISKNSGKQDKLDRMQRRRVD